MTDGRPTLWASRQIDRHANTILFLLLVVAVIAAVWAALGWNAARDAQRRLTSVEAEQRAEKIGKQIADVASCFNRANGRPRLIVILRGIAVELEPDPRQALAELIDAYERDTPTQTDCIALALKSHIDPKPYLKDPPSEAGNSSNR